jgi:hypothetical protein
LVIDPKSAHEFDVEMVDMLITNRLIKRMALPQTIFQSLPMQTMQTTMFIHNLWLASMNRPVVINNQLQEVDDSLLLQLIVCSTLNNSLVHNRHSLRFKIKVMFGCKLRYEIKVMFGEISLKQTGMLPKKTM